MQKPLLTVAYEQKLYQQMRTNEPRDIIAAMEILLADRETLDARSGLRALDYLDILRDKFAALLQEILDGKLALHQKSAWTDPGPLKECLDKAMSHIKGHIRGLIIRSTAIDSQTSVVLCDVLSDSSGPTVLQDEDDSRLSIDYSLADLSSLMEQMQGMSAALMEQMQQMRAPYAFANPTRPLPQQQQAKKRTKQWTPSLSMFTRSRAFKHSLGES